MSKRIRIYYLIPKEIYNGRNCLNWYELFNMTLKLTPRTRNKIAWMNVIRKEEVKVDKENEKDLVLWSLYFQQFPDVVL